MTSWVPIPFHYRTGYSMSSEVFPRGKTNTAHSRENVILGQLSSAVLDLYLYQLTFISVDASAVSRNRQIWSNIMSKFRHFEVLTGIRGWFPFSIFLCTNKCNLPPLDWALTLSPISCFARPHQPFRASEARSQRFPGAHLSSLPINQAALCYGFGLSEGRNCCLVRNTYLGRSFH